jgi:hypothetical protein
LYGKTVRTTIHKETIMAKFQVFKGKNGEYYWRMRANNGQVVATGGEGYKAKASCLHGIELVKTLGPDANIEEEE